MPRLQVYLPDELHERLKRFGLSPSELLQEAVRVEVRRREQLARLDEYLGELSEEIGVPGPAEKARAERIVRRIHRRSARRSG